MASVPSSDIIRLEGMLFFGRHGARKEEQTLGQQFKVDIAMEADLSKPRKTDRLADTIDYGLVYETAREVIEGPSYNLLERLADEVAARVLKRFPAQAVRVRVQKPRLPIRGGVMDGVSVEVYRRRARR
ncbi:MAG: dihydroneopterin aldolase [Chloroflexi bacterium]|nr:dihydroneopterin aldolase [Chloroflexota bacterium]